MEISIHTALAGCDNVSFYPYAFGGKFQSTQPSQAVTCRTYSITQAMEFQSTQPSQAVTLLFSGHCSRYRFQSTQPSQAVTAYFLWDNWIIKISIHTALAGCDPAH